MANSFNRYIKMATALYTGTQPPVVKKRVKTDVATEAKEQMVFVVWLQKNNILHYHIPNGGRRDKREAFGLKLMGVSSGVPDICIPKARKGYHGLYIELKRTFGGRVSESQKDWLRRLRVEGYRAEVCVGAQEAILLTNEYLNHD